MEQLYSDLSNWQNELKKLNRSTVSAFLDLLDVLIRCPDHPERRVKLENLRLLFINMHHLINEYRPVQAHDTLKAIMKAKIESVKEMTVQLRELIDNGRKVLDEETKVLSNLPEEVDRNTRTEVMNEISIYENAAERWRKLAEEVAIERQARSMLTEKQEALKMDVALCRLCDTYDAEYRTCSGMKECMDTCEEIRVVYNLFVVKYRAFEVVDEQQQFKFQNVDNISLILSCYCCEVVDPKNTRSGLAAAIRSCSRLLMP
uniref:Mediator of RNA polymerase II transcription subunit 7 n=1 Tax=Syphacia muris TaxID=451379 RepID=A0A0N5B0L1_9BILA